MSKPIQRSTIQNNPTQLLYTTKYDREVDVKLSSLGGLTWLANWVYYKVYGGHSGIAGADIVKAERVAIANVNSTLDELITALAQSKFSPDCWNVPSSEAKATSRIEENALAYSQALTKRVSFFDRKDQLSSFCVGTNEIEQRINAYNEKNFANEGYNIFGNYVTNDNYIIPIWHSPLAYLCKVNFMDSIPTSELQSTQVNQPPQTPAPKPQPPQSPSEPQQPSTPKPAPQSTPATPVIQPSPTPAPKPQPPQSPPAPQQPSTPKPAPQSTPVIQPLHTPINPFLQPKQSQPQPPQPTPKPPQAPAPQPSQPSQPQQPSAPQPQAPKQTKVNSDLEQQFLAGRALHDYLHSQPSYSGYHVTFDFSKETIAYYAQPAGRPNVFMDMPKGYEGLDCQCCHTGFEHTYKNRAITDPLCHELTQLLEPYDMFAVFSPNRTLLIVPDTRKKDIEVQNYQNLWQLKPDQLEKLLTALTITNNYLKDRYNGRISFNQGWDGNQRMPIIHARIDLYDKK